MFKYSLIAISLLLLSSCAHHKDVRPGADGLHMVQVTEETKEKGSRNALSQAKHFCEQRSRYAAIINEETKYIGSMSETDYNSAKTAAKVTQGVGSAAYVFGGKKESNLGGIAVLGGGIANKAIGKGYMTTMKFNCK